MNDRDELRLRHVLDAAALIAEFMKGVDHAGYLADRKLQDAVIRNLEVIGEACANLTEELRAANSDVPWTKAMAIRNRLIHGYFDVDLAIVWETVSVSLPHFVSQIRAILASK